MAIFTLSISFRFGDAFKVRQLLLLKLDEKCPYKWPISPIQSQCLFDEPRMLAKSVLVLLTQNINVYIKKAAFENFITKKRKPQPEMASA